MGSIALVYFDEYERVKKRIPLTGDRVQGDG
jgi:hypothetical protein